LKTEFPSPPQWFMWEDFSRYTEGCRAVIRLKVPMIPFHMNCLSCSLLHWRSKQHLTRFCCKQWKLWCEA